MFTQTAVSPRSAIELRRPPDSSAPRATQKFVITVILSVLAIVVTACADAEGPVPVARLQVEPVSAERVMGYQVQLRATAFDDRDNVMTDRALTWTSSNPSIATVDGNGLVSTHTPGVAVVIAESEGHIGSSTITVMVVPVASVLVSPSVAEILPGETVQLHAATLDSVGGTLTDRSIAWSSSDEEVARVNANGLVTGQMPGTATISASSETKVGTTTITVMAPPDPCALTAARPITLGSTTFGSLVPTDCPLGDGSYYDLYQFQLTAPATVQVDLVSVDFDTFLWLLSSTTTIAMNDDSGANWNARIVAPLAAGTYYIAANSWLPGRTGSYSLTLTVVAAANRAGAMTEDAATEPLPAKRSAPPKRFRPVR